MEILYWILFVFFGFSLIFCGFGWLDSLCYSSFSCDIQYVDKFSLIITFCILIFGLVLIYIGIKKIWGIFATERKGLYKYGIVVKCCKFNEYDITKANHYCLKVLVVDDEDKVRIFNKKSLWGPYAGTFLKVKHYKNNINIIDFVRNSSIPDFEKYRLESNYNEYINNKGNN